MAVKMIDERAFEALIEAKGGRHNSRLRSLRKALYLRPDERLARHTQMLAERFELDVRLKERRIHPFLPSPQPELLLREGLLIGRIPQYKEPVYIPLEGHKYIAGMAGSGKTTLVEMIIALAYRAGLRIIIFDPEGQFAADIGGMFRPGDLQILDAEHCAINPFQSPPRCDLHDWLGRLANVDRECWFYRRGAENFSTGVALKVLQASGHLSLPSFFRGVLAARPKGGNWREHEYYETVKTTTESLMHYLPSMCVEQSNGFNQVFSSRVSIIDESTLENNQFRKYVTSLALAWLLASRPYSETQKTDTLVIFDEVHLFASVDLTNTSDNAEMFFANAMRRSRKRGFSFITLDQNPAKTHPVVRGNSATKIVMRLGEGHDKDTIASDFNLNREQRAFLDALGHREAVVQLPLIPQPFLVEIPDIDKG